MKYFLNLMTGILMTGSLYFLLSSHCEGGMTVAIPLEKIK